MLVSVVAGEDVARQLWPFIILLRLLLVRFHKRRALMNHDASRRLDELWRLFPSIEDENRVLRQRTDRCEVASFFLLALFLAVLWKPDSRLRDSDSPLDC